LIFRSDYINGIHATHVRPELKQSSLVNIRDPSLLASWLISKGGCQYWVRIQEKTFTRWCNVHLSSRQLEIPEATLCTGSLDTGATFGISWRSFPRKSFLQSTNVQQGESICQQSSISFAFLKDEAIKLVGIGPEGSTDSHLCNSHRYS